MTKQELETENEELHAALETVHEVVSAALGIEYEDLDDDDANPDDDDD